MSVAQIAIAYTLNTGLNAFALAGARALVMSLWKVSDEETRQLMGAFYEELLEARSPDSATALRSALAELCGTAPQVIINDSLGRAWRNGTVGVAIGCAGIDPLHTQIGDTDLFGNVLEVTEPAVADELAAAASLVMGQAREACPVVLARGASLPEAAGGSQRLIRDKALDMFR